jgi:hypothetical protein
VAKDKATLWPFRIGAMSEHYSHLLIPVRPDFVPQPAQVAVFLEGLAERGSAPWEPSIRIGKHSGTVLTAKNIYTGEVITVPRRDFIPLENLDAIPASLDGLPDYLLNFSGKGPSMHSPLRLYLPDDRECQTEVSAEYFYEVNFNLRESSVSMSEVSWTQPCASHVGEATFRNPWNNAVIIVPNAACARFWIEFKFGNWLVPKIEGSFELLPPEIPALASESFGVNFKQGGIFS